MRTVVELELTFGITPARQKDRVIPIVTQGLVEAAAHRAHVAPVHFSMTSEYDSNFDFSDIDELCIALISQF